MDGVFARKNEAYERKKNNKNNFLDPVSFFPILLIFPLKLLYHLLNINAIVPQLITNNYHQRKTLQIFVWSLITRVIIIGVLSHSILIAFL